MGSSGDSEKMIQRLNDELQEARDMANAEKQKCNELQGNGELFRFSQCYVLDERLPKKHNDFVCIWKANWRKRGKTKNSKLTRQRNK